MDAVSIVDQVSWAYEIVPKLMLKDLNAISQYWLGWWLGAIRQTAINHITVVLPAG